MLNFAEYREATNFVSPIPLIPKEKQNEISRKTLVDRHGVRSGRICLVLTGCCWMLGCTDLWLIVSTPVRS